ncbi:uncharacterized protein H6S33_010510 [Morchella sextelata]|uniref:uncharacterized protein n=1 Tax=Morchella sextelata TaxID=1174677 RepID=UPI001D04EB52|nr:uncharacterized protein H6S33_010510 [Morchella sextelata]KAH0602193.1 hypothetical protein H6S33_010510 [Morchella sextelata]
MPHVRAREYLVPDSQYRLEYVEVIQRHHKRTPYQSNTFPVEDIEWNCGDTRQFYYGEPMDGFEAAKCDNYEDPLNPLRKRGYQGTCQFPQITKDGLDDSYTHGKDLHDVYHKLLKFLPAKYDETTVFRATSNVITSQVAGALIKGMFGSSDKVPVLQQYDTIDSLRPGYSCPYADSIHSGYQGSNINWTEHLKLSQWLFDGLDAVSGVNPNDSEWHSWYDHYFDNLSSRLCHSKPLPCSVTSPSKCISHEMADSVFRIAQYEYSYIFRDTPRSLEYARTKHNIGHDGSISLLLGALQISEMVWPGMGSEVIFELYSSSILDAGLNKKWYMRVLWGGKVMHSSAMGEVNMIPVEEFMGYLRDLVGDSGAYVREKCGI